MSCLRTNLLFKVFCNVSKIKSTSKKTVLWTRDIIARIRIRGSEPRKKSQNSRNQGLLTVLLDVGRIRIRTNNDGYGSRRPKYLHNIAQLKNETVFVTSCIHWAKLDLSFYNTLRVRVRFCRRSRIRIQIPDPYPISAN